MRGKAICIIAMVLGLASCQNEDIGMAKKGYVLIGDIVRQEQTEIGVSLTRAVDSDLNVEIVDDGGNTVALFTAGDTAVGQKIELNEGTYTLRAYTDNYNRTYSGTEQGAPKHYAEQSFIVYPEKVTYVSLRIPMRNTAISLLLPYGFSAWFSTCDFTVSLAGRELTISEGQTVYFDCDDGDLAVYTLSVTNTDGESMTSSASFSVSPGSLYVVTYEMEAQAFVVRKK